MREINFKGEKIYLIYNRNEGRQDKYTGKTNLKSQEYEILYDILVQNQFVDKN